MSVSSPAAVRDPEGQSSPPRCCRKGALLALLTVAVLTAALLAVGTFVLLRWPCEGKEKAGERTAVVGIAVAGQTATAAAAKIAQAAVAAKLLQTEKAAAELAQTAAEGAEDGSGVHLTADNVDMQELVMPWTHNHGLKSIFIGPDFDYRPELKRLVVHKKGLYYLYAQLSVTCVLTPCQNSTTVTLVMQRENPSSSVLQVPLNLLKPDNFLFSDTLVCLSAGDQIYGHLKLHKNNYTQCQLNQDNQIHGHLELHKNNYTRWQLNQDDLNFFGLLRVSTECK